MKKIIVITFVFIGLFASGCMEMTIVAGGDKNDNKHGRTYWRSYYSDSWWGNSPMEDMQKCIKTIPESEQVKFQTRSLYKVLYSDNYLYSLTAVLSFGLFVPVEIHWWLQDEKAKPYDGPIIRPEKKRPQKEDEPK
jgi:hypothetical protein